MAYLKSFLGGFFATLLFHQGALGLFYVLGIFPRAPFSMTPTEPFGVPSVLSLAFFGGLWGPAIWYFIKNDLGKKFWIKSVLLGAIGPTAVALGVVFPLKGIEFQPAFVVGGLILNGAWGLGLGLFMKLAQKK